MHINTKLITECLHFSVMVLLFLHYIFLTHTHMKVNSDQKKFNYKTIFKGMILYHFYAYLHPPLATFCVALPFH